MRVAYVSADLGVPVYGQKGCSRHVQEILRGLRRTGIDTQVYAARVGGTPPDDFVGLSTCHFSDASRCSAEDREQYAIESNMTLLEHLANDGPFDAVYERYSLWGFAGMEYAQRLNIPGVLEVNAPLIEEQQSHRALYRVDEAEQIADRAFSAASAIVAVSEGVARYLRGRGVPKEKIHVIPNGVDAERFYPGERHGKDSVFTVGFVGTLKPWHGMQQLLEAFLVLRRMFPDTRLLIVGDGPERVNLERQLSCYGEDAVAAVQWTGPVAPHEVADWIAEMDVAVAPYPHSEEFYFSPLKVFEYMAAGKPVIASAIGQIVHVIDHGRNGLLVEPGSVVALVAALQCLRENPVAAAQLGHAARQTILQSHTWQHVVDKILQLLARCSRPVIQSRRSVVAS
jgi:glycosyltransferase involved in cell wall biosynthesis